MGLSSDWRDPAEHVQYGQGTLAVQEMQITCYGCKSCQKGKDKKFYCVNGFPKFPDTGMGKCFAYMARKLE